MKFLYIEKIFLYLCIILYIYPRYFALLFLSFYNFGSSLFTVHCSVLLTFSTFVLFLFRRSLSRNNKEIYFSLSLSLFFFVLLQPSIPQDSHEIRRVVGYATLGKKVYSPPYDDETRRRTERSLCEKERGLC